MKRTLLFLFAVMATLAGFAQTNLTSGKTVVPLGGLKEFKPSGVLTEEKLQLITQDGNTENVFLFPESGDNLEYNKTLGIQGFYIDLGESKSIGSIKSTWEGADCGANIYVTDTQPAADGTITGETLIATFDDAQAGAKDAAVSATNSGRYLVFVPTTPTNFAWGVKIRTFAAFEKEASVLTSLEVNPTMVKVGEATTLTIVAKDQVGLTLDGVSYSVDNGTLEGNVLTAATAGNVVITGTLNDVSVTATIIATNISAPTANATEPTDLAANVIAIYSAKYGKGISESNPGWGVGGGAPNPLYTTIEEVEIANGHKAVHVKGTGFNSRTAGGVGITNDYSKIYVAVYPFTATSAKIFGDNGYANALTVTGLVPGQWNYIALDNENNLPNYMLVELVGETEFYLDHFYVAKPAVADDEAPVLETAELVGTGVGSVTLKLKATDNISEKVTYVINDGTKDYTTQGNSGAEINYTVGDLEFATAYTFTIVAKDDNENTSDSKTVEATTLAIEAAPAPTQDAADVISVFSDTYTAATGYGIGGWGQSTTVDTQDIEGNQTMKLTNYNYLGFELTSDLDLSEMTHVHIDLLPVQTMNVGITPILKSGTPTENSQSVGSLTPGEWNSIDLPLSQFGMDFTNPVFQIKIDRGTGTETLFVDNIYFYKSDEQGGGDDPDPVDPEATSGNGTYAIPSGVNAGKELQYTWAFTQDGNNVTVTFECTNSADIIGIVDGYIHDKSNGFAEIAGLSYTWENCTVGQQLKVAHKWMFAEGDFVTPDFTYTVIDKQATAINNVNVNVNDNANAVYDLSGRKVADNYALPKGIYIINGKKVVIK